MEDDTFNQVKGSLRFNYMFPVDDCYISKRDFNKETPGRKEFLRRQWVFCNSITDNIKKMAEETYNGVISGTDSALVNASCDFKLLEDAAKFVLFLYYVKHCNIYTSIKYTYPF